MPQTNTRTTVAIPYELLEAVDQAVSQGLARSRNEFLALALRNQLAQCRRQEIDEAFAGMASDPDYQQESLEITRAFETSDWESLTLRDQSS